jgi:hypothetical protein
MPGLQTHMPEDYTRRGAVPESPVSGGERNLPFDGAVTTS